MKKRREMTVLTVRKRRMGNMSFFRCLLTQKPVNQQMKKKKKTHVGNKTNSGRKHKFKKKIK